jgi:hypothetical protein
LNFLAIWFSPLRFKDSPLTFVLGLYADYLCNRSLRVLKNPFKLVDHFPTLKPFQEFPVLEKKIRILRLPELRLIHCKGFVNDDPVFFESLLDARHERAMEIAEDQNGPIVIMLQRVPFTLLKVYLPQGNLCPLLLSESSGLRQGFLRNIGQHDSTSPGCQKNAVVSISASKIKDRPIQPFKKTSVIHEQLVRRSHGPLLE